MEPNVPGHWTDDELIACLYAVKPKDAHVESCVECQARLAAMQANRLAVEADCRQDVSFDFLALQRRKIYARLTGPANWWPHGQLRRWASAVMTVLVVAGGFLVYEEKQTRHTNQSAISDAQLALQVSGMAQDGEPQSTAPLQALFEE